MILAYPLLIVFDISTGGNGFGICENLLTCSIPITEGPRLLVLLISAFFILVFLLREDKFPDACDNTLKIANRVVYNFEFDKDYLPDFPVESDSLSAEEYLREKVLIGAKEKYQEFNLEVQKRIDYELEVINSMGFASYFLIVGDLIDIWALKRATSAS